jgi:hypothetical protein
MSGNNLNRKRNEIETPVQWDTKWVGMRGVTDGRGRERKWMQAPLIACMPGVSISMYGSLWVKS